MQGSTRPGWLHLINTYVIAPTPYLSSLDYNIPTLLKNIGGIDFISTPNSQSWAGSNIIVLVRTRSVEIVSAWYTGTMPNSSI